MRASRAIRAARASRKIRHALKVVILRGDAVTKRERSLRRKAPNCVGCATKRAEPQGAGRPRTGSTRSATDRRPCRASDGANDASLRAHRFSVALVLVINAAERREKARPSAALDAKRMLWSKHDRVVQRASAVAVESASGRAFQSVVPASGVDVELDAEEAEGATDGLACT
jgi:hypothetical protein